ncbi:MULTISPECIES: hypothetical protein [Bacillus]|uniref:hypothetical protein n=1 Tax=Bacillus TaxID=1386 RepID=UPI001AFD8A81|nr:hypothetical protein [Bacillus sonorensis]MCY7858861.1 hypothetical protein [Bacillus sonorensis]MCY8565612.1 hypothetical protein [Bacillus sonorensis]GIN67607.1 hypothetical protein J41TS2_30280 [Bacillus sonorensis]
MKTYTYKGQEMSPVDFFENIILDCFAEAVFSVDHCVYGDMTEEQQKKVKQTFFEMLEQTEIEKDFDKKYKFPMMIYDFKGMYPGNCVTDLLESFMYREDKKTFTEAARQLEPLKGERVTMLEYDDFGFPSVTQTVVKDVSVEPYAQYKYSLILIHRVKRKHTDYKEVFTPVNTLIVYKGWHDIDPRATEVVSETADLIVKQSRYGAFDARFITDAANSTNLTPIINITRW